MRLAGVIVKYGGVLRKQFILYHSYFGTPTTQGALPTGGTAADYVRLRLDSVRQVGLPATRFGYNLPASAYFPPIHSYAQDLWGYYNKQDSNPTLVVRSNQRGANRDSDSTAVTLGMLRQITYPTGGTSTFRYEANTVYTAERLANSLETLSSITARSVEGNAPVQKDTTFTIAGSPMDRQKVSIVYSFPSPTVINTGGNTGADGPTNSSGSTVTGGSARLTLADAVTGQEYYSATSGVTPVSNRPLS